MSAQISPLEQLEQQSTQGQAAQPAAPQSNLSPLEQLEQKAQQVGTPSGQVTNDVGQQVVVPKDGESYSDTINRAVALTKQRQQNGTQQQAVDAETSTIPAKAAETVAAAPLIGAAGTAASALPGELPEIVKAAGSIGKWVKENPVSALALSKVADELGVHPLDLIHKVSKYGKGLVGD
jgi:hypothetical protein